MAAIFVRASLGPFVPTLPHREEISTNTYFTDADFAPLEAWLDTDEAWGSYGYFWRDEPREDNGVRCRTFVAFNHMPTAFAFKLRFG